jgi:hypothetical protein
VTVSPEILATVATGLGLFLTFGIALFAFARWMLGEMNAQMNALRSEMRTEFKEVRTDIGALTEAVHGLDVRLTRVEVVIGAIDARVTKLEGPPPLAIAGG